MTFGPGTVYGEDGAAATGAYYVLTWIGIIVTVAVLVDGCLGAAHAGAACAPARPRRSASTRDEEERNA